MYYDLESNTIIGNYDHVARFYTQYIKSAEECIDTMSANIISNKPFSLLRIGDIEARYLMYKHIRSRVIRQKIQDSLWWCGVDRNNIPDSSEYLDSLTRCDILGVHDPRVNPVQFWGSSLEALHLNNLLETRPLYEVHAIYKYAGSGKFFVDQWGKTIVIVGGKAAIYAHYFHNDRNFIDIHPDLDFRKIYLAGIIPTPDLPWFAIDSLEPIWNSILQVHPGPGTIYWFSCGLLAKLLAQRVRDRLGCTGLDIGNTLETVMNFAGRRPFMDRFYDKVHPTYEFTLDPQHHTVKEIRNKHDGTRSEL